MINLCQKMSRVETIIRPIHARTAIVTIAAGVYSRYHYVGITPSGPKSENCCTNCGNLAPSILMVICSSFINKQLDLFQNGPPLANRVAPAQVRLYWCPRTLSC